MRLLNPGETVDPVCGDIGPPGRDSETWRSSELVSNRGKHAARAAVVGDDGPLIPSLLRSGGDELLACLVVKQAPDFGRVLGVDEALGTCQGFD